MKTLSSLLHVGLDSKTIGLEDSRWWHREDGLHCCLSSPNLPPGAEELAPTSKTSALNPIPRQAIRMTDNILKVIDEKLNPVSQMFQAQALEPQNCGKQANEVSKWISGAEVASEQAYQWSKALDKEIKEKYTYYWTARRYRRYLTNNIFLKADFVYQ